MTIINTGRTVVSKYIRKQCPNDCRCTRCQREQSANPVLVYVSTLIEHIPDPEDIASEQYVDDAVSGIIVDISNKADKVDGAVENNFSSLDSEGNLLDSGYAASDFADSQDLQDHIDDTNNPHQVTAGQVGADVVGSAATVQGNLGAHELLTTTAHGGIVADTDPRLTDNRNPTLHASTHFTSGTDEIAPGDIGAIPVINPAVAGNLVTQAAGGTLADAGYGVEQSFPTGASVVRRRANGDIYNELATNLANSINGIADSASAAGVAAENYGTGPAISARGLVPLAIGDNSGAHNAQFDNNGVLRFLGANADINRTAMRNEIEALPIDANVTVARTTGYTFQTTDRGAVIPVSGTFTFSLPDGMPVGAQAVLVRTGAGTVTLAAATTLVSDGTQMTENGAVTVIHLGSNVWHAFGKLS